MCPHRSESCSWGLLSNERGDKLAVNRGKAFEGVIQDAFEKIEGVSIDRLHDQMNGYACSYNICDFIVYQTPYEYYIECKSVHGNTLSIHSNDPKRKYGLISNAQWEGLLAKSKIEGVRAGVICWWIDKDVTLYIPISTLETMRNLGKKSVRYDEISLDCVIIPGKKKRVFWDYDMTTFFKEVKK